MNTSKDTSSKIRLRTVKVGPNRARLDKLHMAHRGLMQGWLRRLKDSDKVLAAYLDGKIVGWIIALGTRKPEHGLCVTLGTFTDPAYRGRGVGKALALTKMRRLKRMGATVLEVCFRSPEATKMYRLAAEKVNGTIAKNDRLLNAYYVKLDPAADLSTVSYYFEDGGLNL